MQFVPHSAERTRMFPLLRLLPAAALLGLFCATTPARACYHLPAAETISPAALVAGAHDVYLAKAVSVTTAGSGDSAFSFDVVNRLAGAPRDTLTIPGRLPRQTGGGAPVDHAADAFWQQGGGRLTGGVDCKIHPSFEVGKTYLVFLDAPLSRRSDEEIAMVEGQPVEDKWLAYVTGKLAGRP